MTKNLLIVFVKNVRLGKVKTRLAKTIDDEAALTIYKHLLDITEKAVSELKIDKHIYFSDTIDNNSWIENFKTIQNGNDLGERMKNAFMDGFEKGYENIVLIGSDLPSITAKIIESAFRSLENNDVVFGPAKDGGYYLVGMSNLISFIFNDKPWSQPNLLDITLSELSGNKITTLLLETLNDIDTFEDLQGFPEFLKLISK